eukprot:243273-Pelagomonas_calceolata.AAC.6
MQRLWADRFAYAEKVQWTTFWTAFPDHLTQDRFEDWDKHVSDESTSCFSMLGHSSNCLLYLSCALGLEIKFTVCCSKLQTPFSPEVPQKYFQVNILYGNAGGAGHFLQG